MSKKLKLAPFDVMNINHAAIIVGQCEDEENFIGGVILWTDGGENLVPVTIYLNIIGPCEYCVIRETSEFVSKLTDEVYDDVPVFNLDGDIAYELSLDEVLEEVCEVKGDEDNL